MKVKVTKRGQVTIPKALRQRLGMTSGTVLELSAEQGRLTAVKSDAIDSVSEVYGCLGAQLDTDAIIAQVRPRE